MVASSPEASRGGAESGQAKVANFHPPVFGDEQVLRLEDAMDDALVVRWRQPVGDLHGVVNRFA